MLKDLTKSDVESRARKIIIGISIALIVFVIAIIGGALF